MAKLIHCRVEDTDTSFEVPLTLYYNALAARPVRHVDRPSTLIQLAAVYFARFDKRGDEVEVARAEALLHEALELGSTESHETELQLSCYSCTQDVECTLFRRMANHQWSRRQLYAHRTRTPGFWKSATQGRVSWEPVLSTLWNGVVKPVLTALAFSVRGIISLGFTADSFICVSEQTPGDLSRIFW